MSACRSREESGGTSSASSAPTAARSFSPGGRTRSPASRSSATSASTSSKTRRPNAFERRPRPRPRRRRPQRLPQRRPLSLFRLLGPGRRPFLQKGAQALLRFRRGAPLGDDPARQQDGVFGIERDDLLDEPFRRAHRLRPGGQKRLHFFPVRCFELEAGTTSWTSPMRYASRASKRSP